MASIREVVAALPARGTLFAVPPWTPGSKCVVTEEDSVDGFQYLLEVELAAEVLEVWKDWRRGRIPTTDEAASAEIHYATTDAYEPV